jgi:hypothetical protein
MTHLPYETTHPLGFGVYTKLPPLPAGYQWLQHHNHWLTVRNDFGSFFFVHFPADGGILLIERKRAGLFDWLRTVGRIPLGHYYADYRFTVFLPPQKRT